MGSRLAALAVALVAVPAAPASAAPRPVYSFVPSEIEPYADATTPSTAGRAQYWPETWWPGRAAARAAGGWWGRSTTAGSGAFPAASIERPVVAGRLVQQVRIAGGSPTRVVWTDTATEVLNPRAMDYRTVRSRIFTSDAQGRTILVTGCGENGGPPCDCPPFCSNHSFPADLDGDMLAYIEGYYPNRRIVIDDLTSSAEPLRIETGDTIGDRVRIAGDLIATWTSATTSLCMTGAPAGSCTGRPRT